MTSSFDTPIISDVVREFILENFLPGDPEDTLRNDDLLLEGGIVDSASVLHLVLFLEDRFDIRIPDEELFAENFATVDHISRFVRSKVDLNAGVASG